MVLLLAFYHYFSWRPSPREKTLTAITATFCDLDLYAKNYKKIPSSLQEIPRGGGYKNLTIDGWGHPLVYGIDKDGVITIASLGRDGKFGGEGDDSDISVSYYTKRPNGDLWIGSEMWIATAGVEPDTRFHNK
jgi:hypothetical protein